VVGPAQTMAQRLARLEEEVHEIRGALDEQRQMMDTMARDLSRFTVWAAGGPRCKEIDKVGEVWIIWNPLFGVDVVQDFKKMH
nr:hypothetical protein [Tanacetum cinerariifolium]